MSGKRLKIAYLAFVRIPTEKAHGVQIMKVCEALSDAGTKVSLVIPGRTTHVEGDPFRYYGVKRNFKIIRKWVPDLVFSGRIGFLFSQTLFSMRTIFSGIGKDVIISRDELVLALHMLLGRKCVYDVHNGRSSFIAKFVLERAALIIANSRGTKSFYVEQGVPSKRILVCPNGVDYKQFNISDSKKEAREKLALPLEAKIVLYTGHLYDWKGADTLAESAQDLPADALVVFVGGTAKDITQFQMKYTSVQNIKILGHRPNTEIPLFLRAADILALPNDRVGESEQFTSPIKLFEYLAAGKPIVASNLPPIREVLNEKNAFFFTPGSAEDIAQTITSILDNPEEALKRAGQAKQDAQKYTWNREVLVNRLQSE